uniref:Transmembrane protein n=1 Tax=Steinernema glaseri TaxID=37863 RepID=A0A1I7YEI7_9BILA
MYTNFNTLLIDFVKFRKYLAKKDNPLPRIEPGQSIFSRDRLKIALKDFSAWDCMMLICNIHMVALIIFYGLMFIVVCFMSIASVLLLLYLIGLLIVFVAEGCMNLLSFG